MTEHLRADYKRFARNEKKVSSCQTFSETQGQLVGANRRVQKGDLSPSGYQRMPAKKVHSVNVKNKREEKKRGESFPYWESNPGRLGENHDS